MGKLNKGDNKEQEEEHKSLFLFFFGPYHWYWSSDIDLLLAKTMPQPHSAGQSVCFERLFTTLLIASLFN